MPGLPNTPEHKALASLVQRHCPSDGYHETPIPGLVLLRSDTPTLRMHSVHKPGLCIIAQGSKAVEVNDQRFIYDPLHYLVVSVTLPVSGEVLEASAEEPYLCVRLDLDPAELATLISESGPIGLPNRPDPRGIYVDRIEGNLQDAVIRMLRLLDTPKDIRVLAPLAVREVLYRLLHGPQGQRLHEIAMGENHTHRITQAIEWLNHNYDQPLRIEELARRINLSVSALHHRFKALTTMSPLQYQKQLRLQAARRLMLNEGLEACTAGHRVGYESPSQFSREYSRLFGAPPSRDLARMRNAI